MVMRADRPRQVRRHAERGRGRGGDVAGWRRQAPDEQPELARRMLDGGPGFVDVLHACLGGTLGAVTVRGPHGEPVPATVLTVGSTAYVESAQACGLHLTGAWASYLQRQPGWATRSWPPVVQVRAGIAVGLGGSGTERRRCRAAGGARCASRTSRSTKAPRRCASRTATCRPGTANLVAATDVDIALTGLFGATKTFGPQKACPRSSGRVRRRLEEFVAADLIAACWRRSRRRHRVRADAGGGAPRTRHRVGRGRRRTGRQGAAADLVVTGEGAFDFSSRAGKVPTASPASPRNETLLWPYY